MPVPAAAPVAVKPPAVAPKVAAVPAVPEIPAAVAAVPAAIPIPEDIAVPIAASDPNNDISMLRMREKVLVLSHGFAAQNALDII
jgi:hypothetical protein